MLSLVHKKGVILMITSNIKNYERYLFNDDFADAFKYLISENLSNLPQGKHQITENVHIIRDSYHTRKLGETFWESHEDYIDIQFIIKGEERIAYSPIHHLTEVIYHQENDFKLLVGPVNSSLNLIENDFAIFFPEDAHMPGLNPNDSSEEVHKIVVKIKI